MMGRYQRAVATSRGMSGGQAMETRVAEWMRQADYDLETAEYMLQGGRRFYAVFMCHLGMEKALKGLFEAKLGRLPPKTHNLVYLASQAGLGPMQKSGHSWSSSAKRVCQPAIQTTLSGFKRTTLTKWRRQS